MSEFDPSTIRGAAYDALRTAQRVAKEPQSSGSDSAPCSASHFEIRNGSKVRVFDDLIPDCSSSQKREMGMMEWCATEGGRKCPMCGRYAKAETLGDLSFYTVSPVTRITMFGHLPGYGCNQPLPNAKSAAAGSERRIK